MPITTPTIEANTKAMNTASIVATVLRHSSPDVQDSCRKENTCSGDFAMIGSTSRSETTSCHSPSNARRTSSCQHRRAICECPPRRGSRARKAP